MSWTDERIERLKKMWHDGATASQIADELGGVSRNAVIGKAHRLGLQSRPSPVRSNEAPAAVAAAPAEEVVEQPVAEPVEAVEEEDAQPEVAVAASPVAPPQPMVRSIGPGG